MNRRTDRRAHKEKVVFIHFVLDNNYSILESKLSRELLRGENEEGGGGEREGGRRGKGRETKQLIQPLTKIIMLQTFPPSYSKRYIQTSDYLRSMENIRSSDNSSDDRIFY